MVEHTRATTRVSLGPGDRVPAGLPERRAWLGQHSCHFYYGVKHFAVNAGSFLAAGRANGELRVAYATAEGRELVERFLAGGEALLAGVHPFQLLSTVNWVGTAVLTGAQDGGEARLSASPR